MLINNFLIALLPAIGWGSQAILMQIFGGSFENKVVGISWTVLLASIISMFVHSPNYSFNLIFGSSLCGLFWSIGMLLQVKSFDLVGISTAMPISTGGQILGTAIISAIFFHEWTTWKQWIFGILSLVIISIGIVTISKRKNNNHSGKELKQGLIYLFVSTLGLIGYAIIPTVFKLNISDMIFPQGVSIFLFITLFTLFKNKDILFSRFTIKNMVTGLFFELGNLSILLSMEVNGVAVGYTFSQLNVVISTLGGLMILKESRYKDDIKRKILALIFITLGAIVMGLTV
ncbi:GRP family sugar transporter [Lactobacillus corticis]|uniref:Glucose uptake protein n=1 Tax=Lactobacillus corticis TaxID=2201249 RepID=A0A916VHG6_9LACO|nr:GRP family sugar transporter [Lactobacillus corticis]GFZ26145.1 glucose uptake protein [Lactobacillus corticis]